LTQFFTLRAQQETQKEYILNGAVMGSISFQKTQNSFYSRVAAGIIGENSNSILLWWLLSLRGPAFVPEVHKEVSNPFGIFKLIKKTENRFL
jgi:hypothetical protein